MNEEMKTEMKTEMTIARQEDVFITVTPDSIKDGIGVDCLICGEGIPLNENEKMDILHGGRIVIKICDKCKEAVLAMRREIQKRREDEEDS